MTDNIEVIIDSVRVSLMSPQRVVILREKDRERYLPIWVGPYEAEAITVALQEVEMARPLTHDLLKNVFATFGANIVQVEITSLREDIFYGNIVTKVDSKDIDIDSRPSDAIALAVRAHVPIFVNQEVLDVAGIVPERDIQAETPPKSLEIPPSSRTEESEDRLSVYEDFLKKLDNKGGQTKPKK